MGQITKNTGTAGGDFEPAPEGTFQGVICDIIDYGHIDKMFQGKSQGLKPQMSFVYQLGGVDEDDYPVAREDGTPYLLFGQRHVVSLNERAGFYRELGQILGNKKRDELIEQGFDSEDLLGMNVQITVVHNVSQKNGKTYANIDTMSPWLKRYGPPIEVRDYTRRDARPDYLAPELSCWNAGPEGAEAETEPARSEPAPSRPPRAPKAEPDPRATNGNHSAKSHARKLAKGEETEKLPRPPVPPTVAAFDADDDDDPFGDDDDEMLIPMPKKQKANAYGLD